MYSISQNHESKINPGNHISYSLPQITPGNHISYLLPQITPGNHNSYLLPQITLDMSTCMGRHQFFLLQNRQFLAYILYTNIKLTFYLTSTLLRSCFFFLINFYIYLAECMTRPNTEKCVFIFKNLYINLQPF